MNKEIPKQGDLIWINSEPHAGHESGAHDAATGNTFRPMLVISDAAYNQRTEMIVGFPITHTTRIREPFQFTLTGHKIEDHVILIGLLGYDYLARNGKIVDHVNVKELFQAKMAVKDIFGLAQSNFKRY